MDEPIEQQQNEIRAKQFDQRIDELLPIENFYFFKIFPEDSTINIQRNEVEKKELIRLIENQ